MDEPGALLLSPPNEHDESTRLHLHSVCFIKTLELLRSPKPVAIPLELLRSPKPVAIPLDPYEEVLALKKALEKRAYDDTTAEEAHLWLEAASSLGRVATCIGIIANMKRNVT
jgi:hypothetical protein